MKISYNWLKEYINTDLDVYECASILTSTGLEVEKIEVFETVKGGLKGVVVGEVLECIQHPNADRLKLTRVDIGSGEPLPIVCGAPNVAIGQKVLVAMIGATLYPSSGEPLTIKKGKIRGEESHGMICAEDELGLGSSHDGILLLNNNIAVGTHAAEYFQLTTDYSVEIGLTPNRTDAMSHFGVARDLYSAIRNMEGLKNREASLLFPDHTIPARSQVKQTIHAEIKDHEGCPRYAGIILSGIRVTESPAWLKQRLLSVGLKPINNVVDCTNFVQHELGQPLHAFDAEHISGGQVVVRRAHANEKFVTLDGIERILNEEDLMICDQDKPMCIAGVFGGKNSGVSDVTTSIFLESAYFNPVSIRKTARRHGLNTDASFRFERGADPHMVILALERAAKLICEISGANVSSDVIDVYPEPIVDLEMFLRWNYAEKLIGKSITHSRIISILKDLGISSSSENAEGVHLHVPPFKADVKREADVVEEVLRIYGYDHIEMPAQLRSSLSSVPQPDPEKIQNRISDLLSVLGFSEMMGMSMVKEKYDPTSSDVVKILNPLSSDLGVMRNNMLYTGLEAIVLNRNHKNINLRLYEFGKTYHQTNGKYKENKHLTLYLTGRKFPENWNNPATEVSFTDLLGVLEKIMASLGLKLQMNEPQDGLTSLFSGKKAIGVAGLLNEEMQKQFDLRDEVWYADILWDEILQLLDPEFISYQNPGKYPAVRRDLSLLVDQSISFSSLEKLAYESERKLLKKVSLFDVYQGDKLEHGKKSYALSFVLQDASKTLTDEIVDKAMTKIAENFHENLGAVIRQ